VDDGFVSDSPGLPAAKLLVRAGAPEGATAGVPGNGPFPPFLEVRVRLVGHDESWWACLSCGHVVHRVRRGAVRDGCSCGACGKAAWWERFVIGEVVAVREEVFDVREEVFDGESG